MRFDATPIRSFEQYADPLLLRTDLARTLLYLHVNPPLLNLAIGLALKLFGSRFDLAMQALFLGFGAVLAVTSLALMKALGVSSRLALAVAIGVSISPATLLFENWLYGDYLVAALLVAAAWALHRYARSDRFWIALAFCSLLAAVVYIRSLFSIYWMIVVLGVVLVSVPRPRRLALAAVVPLFLVLALYGKNFYLFGAFTTATPPAGLQPLQMTTQQLSDAEVKRLVREGRLSEFATLNPYTLSVRADLFSGAPTMGVPVTDQLVKSTGAENMNNLGFLKIWPKYESDAVAVFRFKPTTFLKHEVAAWLLFFRPPSDYPVFSTANRAATTTVVSVSNKVLYGQPRVSTAYGFPPDFALAKLGNRALETGWLTVAVYLFLFAYAAKLLWSHFAGFSRADRVAILFMLATVAYIVLVGNVFEGVENNRLQFVADPLVATVVAVATTRWWRRRLAP
ncbi:MAG TPA: hypothetical protein VNV65_03585 [Candidatus Solibacter sp.]|nr:hypothetical protein [Candidatus Solibacter sp.]